MGPATPPARLVLESCPPPGAPSGRVQGRRKWARMRTPLAADADPRWRASPDARRDHHSQHPRRLPAPALCTPAVPLCRLSELSLEWPGDKGAPEGCCVQLGDLQGAGWREQRPDLSPFPPAPEAARAPTGGCPGPHHTEDAAGTPVPARRVAQPSVPHPALPPPPRI